MGVAQSLEDGSDIGVPFIVEVWGGGKSVRYNSCYAKHFFF